MFVSPTAAEAAVNDIKRDNINTNYQNKASKKGANQKDVPNLAEFEKHTQGMVASIHSVLMEPI